MRGSFICRSIRWLMLFGCCCFQPVDVGGLSADDALARSVAVSRPEVIVFDASGASSGKGTTITVGDKLRVSAKVTVDRQPPPLLVNLTVRPTEQALEASGRRFAARNALGQQRFPAPLTSESSWCPVEVVRVSGERVRSDPPGSTVAWGKDDKLQVDFVIATQDLAELLVLGPGEWEFEVGVQEERTVPPSRPGGASRPVYVTLAREVARVAVLVREEETNKYFDLTEDELPDGMTALARADTLRLAAQFPARPERTVRQRPETVAAGRKPEVHWVCAYQEMQLEAVVVDLTDASTQESTGGVDPNEAATVLTALRQEFAADLKGIAGKAEVVTDTALLETTTAEVLGGVWRQERAVAHVRTVRFEGFLMRLSATAAASRYQPEVARRFFDSVCLVSVDPATEAGDGTPRP